MQLDTHIIVPHWESAQVFDERTLRITYLNDPSRSARNEVVYIAILSGEDAGWEDSLDARPLGTWLAVPIGGFMASFGYLGIKYREDDLSDTEGSDTPPSIISS